MRNIVDHPQVKAARRKLRRIEDRLAEQEGPDWHLGEARAQAWAEIDRAVQEQEEAAQ